jgi:hypothetical protein
VDHLVIQAFVIYGKRDQPVISCCFCKGKENIQLRERLDTEKARNRKGDHFMKVNSKVNSEKLSGGSELSMGWAHQSIFN